jgi:hypothetical protein
MECSPENAPGCCWWGRGPSQLTGVHNMKIFDNWLIENSGIFGTSPSICSNPGILCTIDSKTSNGASIVWLSSLFYWITVVQKFPEYKPQFKKFMDQLQTNNKFLSKTTDDLINDNPASWPSGIGSVINLSSWSNLASQNVDRVCGFLRILRLLNLMEESDNSEAPNCGVNPNLPLPSNCCAQGYKCSESTWCNGSEANCTQCAGTWLN